MGNSLDSGFNEPPPKYLKEIRKKTNRHLRELAAKRHSELPGNTTITKKKEQEGAIKELTSKSVKEYVIDNPPFLDDLVANHISKSRIRAWLKDSKEKDEETNSPVKTEKDKQFTSEVVERIFRHRQILLITRMRLIYPKRLKKSELDGLMERHKTDEFAEEVETHLFPYTEIQSDDICKVFIYMATKLLGKHAFPMPELCYFLCALRSNYLNIEYHNFHHALSHAQSMYWILRKNPGVFNELEMKCLLVSAISHDVGHPGVNDAFLKNVGTGLDKLYQTPILENHHVQTTFLILQDINCNVFCDLDPDDYRQVMDEIHHSILSTSLHRYKSQNENMRHIIATDLNFDRQEVRDAIKSLLMMTCDLCASWKAWQEHKNTVWALYKEFYSQGDKEVAFNLESIPMMLRTNSDNIPEYQIGFMENVIIPIFKIAIKVFPNTSCIIDATKENLELWKTYL